MKSLGSRKHNCDEKTFGVIEKRENKSFDTQNESEKVKNSHADEFAEQLKA